MTIDEVNNSLRNKKRAIKTPATNNTPDVAALQQRVSETRKQVGVVFEQAQRFGSSKVAAQARELSAKLVALEAELAKISIA